MRGKINLAFVISLVACVALAIWAIVSKESLVVAVNAALVVFAVGSGWPCVLAMVGCAILAIVIAFSKFCSIKLSPDDSNPEYSSVSLFAMLLGGGMLAVIAVAPETGLFAAMQNHPMGAVLLIAAIIFCCVFFVIYASVGVFVPGALYGQYFDPHMFRKMLWGSLQVVMVIALLTAAGLKLVQAGTAASMLPFALAVLVLAIALMKVLKNDVAADFSETRKTYGITYADCDINRRGKNLTGRY